MHHAYPCILCLDQLLFRVTIVLFSEGLQSLRLCCSLLLAAGHLFYPSFVCLSDVNLYDLATVIRRVTLIIIDVEPGARVRSFHAIFEIIELLGYLEEFDTRHKHRPA